jgi:Tfp pilus assembly protein PilX
MKNIMKSKHSSKGAALFIGIILLIILSLFVLGAMRDVLLQERMAGAYRNSALAENAIDSLQRDANRQLFDLAIANGGNAPDLGAFANENGRNPIANTFRLSSGYPASTGNLSPLLTYSDAAGDSLAQPGAIMVEGPISIKRNNGSGAILESQLAVPNGGGKFDLVAYRITSKATGGTDQFARAAETTYFVVSSRTGQ